MRKPLLLLFLAAALSPAAAGCIIAHDYGPPIPGPVFIEGCDYIYFPAYCAYGCTDRDDWWIFEGDVWVHSRERPARISVTANVAWVPVNVRGPEPFRLVEEHRRRFPVDWVPDRDRGPPPGRGWRK